MSTVSLLATLLVLASLAYALGRAHGVAQATLRHDAERIAWAERSNVTVTLDGRALLASVRRAEFDEALGMGQRQRDGLS